MKISIVGAGNIGIAFARGFANAIGAEQICLMRRNIHTIQHLQKEGFHLSDQIQQAVEFGDYVMIAVLPQQVNEVLHEVQKFMDAKRQILISVVTGLSMNDIEKIVGTEIGIVRAMPNTALSLRASMTCYTCRRLSSEKEKEIETLLELVGVASKIKEEMMTSATALCACGTAFFLRAIRAASQGGVEIGFHAEEALKMAVQTAKGSALLLEQEHSHPEQEIDKVTSPQGCTIAGLNEMEHNGFSSALIKGIQTSFKKATTLYKGK